MSTSDEGGVGGPLGPVCALRRTVTREGVSLQRDVEESLLEEIERAEDRCRRVRLSSHYAAVRGVDQVETLHPDEEPPTDPLYDGVGRTFEILTDLDDRARESAITTVETAATLSERLTRRLLSPGLDPN
ncbi:hypothetical protein [Haloglomus halophilum]|uniref:hypothetical protein n=1 Tax=Haloglomus halophilum TaxID=2962672 RepID=UPI0020C9D5A2|nr:hypothetical protein [Haloglomus halophilum]